MDSIGQAINNLGQVTGGFYTGQPGYDAFLYSNGKMVDLGTGYGYAINDEGVVVGSTSSGFLAASLGEALLYSNGRMVDLNDVIDSTLGVHLGSAMGINDAGQIVNDGGGRAYLLTPVPEPGASLFSGKRRAAGSGYSPIRHNRTAA